MILYSTLSTGLQLQGKRVFFGREKDQSKCSDKRGDCLWEDLSKGRSCELTQTHTFPPGTPKAGVALVTGAPLSLSPVL